MIFERTGVLGSSLNKAAWQRHKAASTQVPSGDRIGLLRGLYLLRTVSTLCQPISIIIAGQRTTHACGASGLNTSSRLRNATHNGAGCRSSRRVGTSSRLPSQVDQRSPQGMKTSVPSV